ncbi:MAG: hypothetical protein FWB80_05870 [Defluviitaleaceae bacterium]|nr:hypothetical protein [Defluviitaleaceae bacterium]
MVEEKEKTTNKDEFFAVVSAITRFIETADEETIPKKKATERKIDDGSYA